jgi:hypothetical protein
LLVEAVSQAMRPSMRDPEVGRSEVGAYMHACNGRIDTPSAGESSKYNEVRLTSPNLRMIKSLELVPPGSPNLVHPYPVELWLLLLRVVDGWLT